MSVCQICLLLILQTFHTACEVTFESCYELHRPTVYREGDLVLGGFFPLYTWALEEQIVRVSFLMKPIPEEKIEWWFWKNYQYVLAFLFAIEEINKSPNLLPNLSLGSDLYNAFPTQQRTLESAVVLFSGGNQPLPNYNCNRKKQPIAVFSGTTSAFAAELGSLLELYKSPQITYGPFDPILSNKNQFSSLYQIAPKDSFLTLGLIGLLHHFGWTWVALFVPDDTKGEQFLQDLKAQMLRQDICVAFTEKLPVTTGFSVHRDFKFVIRFRVSSANVYIMYGDLGSLLILAMQKDFNSASGKVWIMGNPHIPWWDFVFRNSKNMLPLFHGSLSFSYQKREIPGFQQFLKTLNPYQYPEDLYYREFWILNFNCTVTGSHCSYIGDCPSNASLEFMEDKTDLLSVSDSSYLIYNAVYAVAQVVHRILLEKSKMGCPGGTEQPVLLPWQLHSLMRKTIFTNSAGDNMSFGDNEQYMAQYDIQNLVKFPNDSWMLVKVGEFVSKSPHDRGLVIDKEMLKWPDVFQEAQLWPMIPKDAFTYIQYWLRQSHLRSDDAQQCFLCPPEQYPNSERTHCLPKPVIFLGFGDSLGMALACTALCFSVVTAVVLGLFVKHRDTPIVKANNRALSFTLLISLLLCFLCSLLFIGHPNTATCILRQVTFGLVFTVAVSTILAKTMTVILAFKAMTPGRTPRRLLLSGASNSAIPICSLIQVIICAIWLGSSPPFVDTDSHSEPRSLIIMCNKGSVTAFYCVLGYLGSLALGSFTVAFLARNLPDTFNEARFLTFSMLLFCSVWVTFLPVYHSTKGKVMVAVEVFSILVSSAGLLGCIFVPKCYTILMRPVKNSLKDLRRSKFSRGNEA
ncbi:Vomeronasal type-2 receptor 26 [Tupaia chinensis]|uniref:Vomeronasal type-2 receptor 26 n=1 Tax=Tupaia chinensis TaxID=246437 RepID=L9J9N9_TUPCH|nr:Vomeronasal type-2 receptor 26 [Tupaia chinensis]